MSNPGNPEDEYFKRLDAEKKARIREEMELASVQTAQEELRATHANRCGKCGNEMQPELFKGVEIDVCGNCGAVLLDTGELETLAGQDQRGVFETISEVFGFSRQKREESP